MAAQLLSSESIPAQTKTSSARFHTCESYRRYPPAKIVAPSPQIRYRNGIKSTICTLAIALSAAAQTPPAAVLNRYCSGCHNANLKSGGFSLEAMTQSADAKERAVRKLRTRQMPPAGLPRPADAVYESVAAALTADLDARKPNPGRTDTFRRLSRTEYRNAVRDLLHLDVDVASLLPADEASHGFDTVATGELSPALLEKYLAAARKISRLATGAPAGSPGGQTFYIRADLTQEGHMEGLPFGTRGGTRVAYTFPADGKYDFQLRLSRDRDERVEGLLDPHELELALDGERLKLFAVKRPPAGAPHHLVDKDFIFRAAVKAGPHDITAAFLAKTAALADSERQPYHARYNADRHPRAQPAIYSISITGPYDATGVSDTPSRRRIFACAVQTDACARQNLTAVLRRAYRRPIAAADLEMPMRFYAEGGMEMALRAILTSPQFLFRVERDPPNTPPTYKIPGVELASRLSFFLWSSIPDDALLKAAIKGDLRNPQLLAQHVDRMLKDERANALVSNFAAQWLYLRNLESVNPDPRLFPDFDDNLRQAMRRETELLVESVLRENRSVLDLLRANYTFLNERLAKHYGVPGVYGNRFRRVPLDGSTMRGGLLTHGSVLTVSSYATRTSPVLRGKWVLTNILATPPTPPPAAVPALRDRSPSRADTLRDRLAEHRANPACAGCHNVMDPIGFALEHYDATGRWRADEDGVRIDATGELPDGGKFHDAASLQRAILAKPENFVSALSEKLLVYALGRGIETYDGPAVRRIVRDAKSQDYRFPAIVKAIVESIPFQMRRSP